MRPLNKNERPLREGRLKLTGTQAIISSLNSGNEFIHPDINIFITTNLSTFQC